MSAEREQWLVEVRARYEASTPGEWYQVTKGNSIQSHAIESHDGMKVCSNISPKTSNAQFIAHAHQDVPRLLAEVERLELELRREKQDRALDNIVEIGPR